MNDRWISFEEVARALDLSRPTVRRMLREGKLPGLTEHHGTARVDRKTFEKWLVSEGSVKSVKSVTTV